MHADPTSCINRLLFQQQDGAYAGRNCG